jgi:tRNA(Ile)-lysidine synthase
MTDAPGRMPRSLQDLPPRWAHFCLGIEKFITRELNFELAGKTAVVGLSGGVDSTALLLCLHCLCTKNNGRIVAVHLNHQLRPEAVDDARWAAVLCESLGVECMVRDADVAAAASASGIGIEEAGREARYQLFSDALVEHGADFVAVGHHLDDLGEDVLMRLVRGTAWPGLSGMPGRDDARRLLRPLLLTPKAILTEFLREVGVSWREDVSNADPRWTRNRIRGDVMPLLIQENPNFLDSIARLWRVGNADSEYWSELTESIGPFISQATLTGTRRALRLRLYKSALDGLGPGQALAENLFRLDRAWQEGRIGALIQFPGDKTASITANGLVFSAKH